MGGCTAHASQREAAACQIWRLRLPRIFPEGNPNELRFLSCRVDCERIGGGPRQTSREPGQAGWRASAGLRRGRGVSTAMLNGWHAMRLRLQKAIPPPMRRPATLPILIPMAWITVYLLGAGWDFLAPVGGGSATTSASCGSALLMEQTAGRIFPAESTRVLLVLDDEWRRRFGDDGSGVARSLLTEVSGMFKGVHIHLLPVGIASWTAPRGARTA